MRDHHTTQPRPHPCQATTGPDPYPERPQRYPGAQPSKALVSPLAWEFTNGLPLPRPVVHPVPPSPDRVITIEAVPGDDVSFAASLPQPASGGGPRLTLWAVLVAATSHTTLAAITAVAGVPPLVAATAAASLFVCSLLLMASEQISNVGAGARA